MPLVKNKETGHTFRICPDERKAYEGVPGFTIVRTLPVLPQEQAEATPSGKVMELLKCPTLVKPGNATESFQQGDRREGIG